MKIFKRASTLTNRKITNLVIYGSVVACLILTILLIIYDAAVLKSFRFRTLIGLLTIFYLLTTAFIAYRNHIRVANWMIIILYTSVAFVTLLYWGLNAAAGIFAISFVVILAGIMLGSRATLPTAIIVALVILIIQFLHESGYITPRVSALSSESSYLDVIAYITVLCIFSLVTWMYNRQIEKSFALAKEAETTIRMQKDTIAIELEQESLRLRQTQMKETQQLYKFAVLGQNVAATLHELSNHLSILNLDIDDIKQQHKNSKAIINAEESIEQINLMVKQIRRKLENYNQDRLFNAVGTVRRAYKDHKEKFKQKNVQLNFQAIGNKGAKIKGDPSALIHIITILLSNALDACYELPNAKVSLICEANNNQLTVSVIDNGIGFNDKATNSLFQPTHSKKPTGLGIGLYIARHLVESQFNGNIELVSHHAETSDTGAHFLIQFKTQL